MRRAAYLRLLPDYCRGARAMAPPGPPRVRSRFANLFIAASPRASVRREMPQKCVERVRSTGDTSMLPMEDARLSNSKVLAYWDYEL